MKNLVLFMGGVAALATLSGCARDAAELARDASKELGVPVKLETTSDDECARKQMQSLFEEYVDMSKADRKTVRQNVQKFSALVINKTVQTQKVTGQQVYLAMREYVCDYNYNPNYPGYGPGYPGYNPGYPGRPGYPPGYYNPPYNDYPRCEYRTTRSKNILESLNPVGPDPVNKVTKDGTLSIFTESKGTAIDESTYYVHSRALYEEINSSLSQEFQHAVQSGAITLENRSTETNENCAQSLKMSDIF